MGFFGTPLIASPINCGALAMVISLIIVPYTQQDVTDWAIQFARCYETAGITNTDRIQITPVSYTHLLKTQLVAIIVATLSQT